jgi:hypothetical protein
MPRSDRDRTGAFENKSVTKSVLSPADDAERQSRHIRKLVLVLRNDRIDDRYPQAEETTPQPWRIKNIG